MSFFVPDPQLHIGHRFVRRLGWVWGHLLACQSEPCGHLHGEVGVHASTQGDQDLRQTPAVNTYTCTYTYTKEYP